MSTRSLPFDEALTEAEATRNRLRFLLEASTVLGSSLEFDDSLRRLARLVAATMADVCVVDVVEPNGTLRRAAAAHTDPDRRGLVERLVGPAVEPDPTSPVARVVASGEPVAVPALTEDEARALGDGSDMGFRSSLSLPLAARGRILGVATLISTRDERPIGPLEVELALDLSRRAALAADNARLYGERTRVARALQASLLPRELPEVPGFQVAARYHAAGEGNEVGGDFYDLFDTGDGGWAVVIGDVCGKGPEAAAVTGQARYTVRAAAMRQRRPSRILDTLNEALRVQRDDARFCTVSFVRMKLTTAGARLTVACGGHPPPVILRTDGRVDSVGNPGTLLGVFPDPELDDVLADLGPGDALIMYTDGVIGTPSKGKVMTEERVAGMLAPLGGRSATEIAELLEHAVLEFQGGTLRDDVAILVLRAVG
ncbi:MAG TPA: GAF domain-containing SpoIIE family protein phosphatase [Actinomycetota bacterium]|jgi:serine phosphatase RsbU (regulator of sigma subunit)